MSIDWWVEILQYVSWMKLEDIYTVLKKVLLKFSVRNNYRLTYIYKYFFMTLTLEVLDIYSISPTLDLPGVFSWLNSGCAFLVMIVQKWCVSFSMYPIGMHMVPIFSTIDAIIFDWLLLYGGCRFFHSKVSFFFFF